MSSTADLLAPIPGDEPAGPYLRYDPVYDEIKEARREDPDLPQGAWETSRKTADWPRVVALAEEVLRRRSKDVQVAAWLTEAALHREGFAGLRRGLELLRDLLEGFWDGVHPEIDDGDAEMRAGPLDWVGGKLDVAVHLAPIDGEGHSLFDYRQSRTVPTREEAESDSGKEEARGRAVEEGRLTPEEFDAGFGGTSKAWYSQLVEDLDASLTAIDDLDRIGDERFGDVAPSYLPLRDAIREVRQLAGQLLARKQVLEPDAGEDPSDAGDPAAAGGAADPAADARSGTGPRAGAAAAPAPSATPRSADEAARWIAAAAAYLRAQDPTSPAPYLMLRGFRWGELRASGPVLDPRLLAAPTTEVRTRLKTMLLDGRWPELLAACEEVMAAPQGRGWLDLQRYELTAVDGLGAEYEGVADALRGALHTLLRDVPTLPDATLMDDSPTANAETRAWLQAEGLLDGEAPAPAPERAPRQESGDALHRRAMERLRGGEPQKAIELLMRAATQEKSDRARFLRRSEAAAIMVERGLEAIAMPILQEMMEQIDRHQLEEWEAGETIAHPLGLLFRCIKRLDGDSSLREQLYLRVCRLDPLQAMQITAGEAGDEQPSQ